MTANISLAALHGATWDCLTRSWLTMVKTRIMIWLHATGDRKGVIRGNPVRDPDKREQGGGVVILVATLVL